MKLFILFIYLYGFVVAKKNLSSANKHSIDDYSYYSINYEYELNETILKSDSLILPNPDTVDSKYTVDVLPNIELPDDSLADSDLKDHDFIDNLMYVYYGSHGRKGDHYGSLIIIIGSIISCSTQLLTIFYVLLKKWNIKRDMKGLFIHLMGSMAFSNIIFICGVYAVNSNTCLLIALVLHYIHLLTAFWMFLYCYYIYKRFTNGLQNVKYYYITGYGLPLLFSIVSYLIAPNSYETKRFCFMSVQKGMIINYMLPVSLLIVITTVYSLNGIYKINSELSKLEFTSSAESLNVLKRELEAFNNNKRQECLDEEVISLRESKSCLKLICGVQSGYDIVWFVVVLALENNSDSNAMAIVYAITSFFLNCYIFFKTKTFLPTITYISENTFKGVNVEENGKTPQSKDSSDDIPLLVNSENCTEMRELRLDYISTITT